MARGVRIHDDSQFTLFCRRRFLPYFLIQFAGAFTYNNKVTTVRCCSAGVRTDKDIII